ncbi:hypothetical protein BGY98DRAFT_961225, partial [Russula aff. rugulosa BPL654]
MRHWQQLTVIHHPRGWSWPSFLNANMVRFFLALVLSFSYMMSVSCRGNTLLSDAAVEIVPGTVIDFCLVHSLLVP